LEDLTESPEHLEAFKKYWYEQLESARNLARSMGWKDFEKDTQKRLSILPKGMVKKLPFPKKYYESFVEYSSLLLAMSENENVKGWVEAQKLPDFCITRDGNCE
jgi:hypothetical protein